MTLPRWLSVAALYCLTKSMMLTPCGPSAVPTGGAGVAAPAFSCTLTIAATFFFRGGIGGSYLSFRFSWLCWAVVGAVARSDLADLVKGQLDRSFPAEDRDEHLQLLGVGVDLIHRGRQRREWP